MDYDEFNADVFDRAVIDRAYNVPNFVEDEPHGGTAMNAADTQFPGP